MPLTLSDAQALEICDYLRIATASLRRLGGTVAAITGGEHEAERLDYSADRAEDLASLIDSQLVIQEDRR